MEKIENTEATENTGIPFEGKTIEMRPFTEADLVQCGKCGQALGKTGSCSIYKRKPNGVILGNRSCDYFEEKEIDG